MQNFFLGLALASSLLFSAPVLAQEHKRVSPHETISAEIDGEPIMIIYGRPYTKNPHTGEVRRIWGGLVPYGHVWRTGADEATLMVLHKAMVVAGKTIPAGAYTLWTLPNADGSAQLIINKQIGQWGEGGPGPDASAHEDRDDVARVPLQHENLKTPVDQFTIAVDKNPSGGGTLSLAWENTRYFVPFTVTK